MLLNYDEMHHIFQQLGFKDFYMRQYDVEMEYLLSFAVEVNARVCVFDVVPGGLENGLNDGIALMEKHYNKPTVFKQLCEKWNEILICFQCYYPLEHIFVSGMSLPSDEDFFEKTPNQDGYVLDFPLESIQDMDLFIDDVLQKTYGSLTFCFPSLQMAFRYFRDDVYFIVTLKKVTEGNVTAIKLLDRLVTAQGLFLLEGNKISL